MKKTNSRTIHQYLSVVIGIQLLFWTTSSLIFSWNPIGKVRGEHRDFGERQSDLGKDTATAIQNKSVAGYASSAKLKSSKPVVG